MRLANLLTLDVIKLDLEATDKYSVIKELVNILIEAKKISKEEEEKVIKVVIEREELMSTSIGHGVAIPHAKYSQLPQTEMIAALGRSNKGVDFDTPDKKPVYLFFLLLTGENTAGKHLKILAKISRMLKQQYIRDQIIKADTKEEILSIIRREEAKL